MDGKYIKGMFKIFLFMVLIAFIAQLVSFAVYYLTRKNFKETEFHKMEKERCEQVLKSNNAEINDYSYCKNFLKWLETNTNNY